MITSNQKNAIQRRWDDLSPEDVNGGEFPIRDYLRSSAYFGATAASAGVLAGSVYGILRSRHPVAFAAACGIGSFGLGSTFWMTRQCILYQWQSDPPRRTVASTIAGVAAGASVSGLIRGRANVLPGALVWGLTGLIGQRAWNAYENSKHQSSQESSSSVFSSKWSPLKRLSDDEYEDMLRDRILKVEAELALVDEDLEKLRKPAQ